MSTSHFVEVATTQTHIVVSTHKRLILHIADARAVAINGVSLTLVSVEKQLWIWHTQRKVGRHLMLISRDLSTQLVFIECVAETAHRDLIMALRDALSAIDTRLCAGQSALQSTSVNHAVFASLIGMTVESYVRSILRYIHTPSLTSLHEWQGDGQVELRMDRVVVRDATPVPLAYQYTSQHKEQVIASHLLDILQALEPSADYLVYDTIQQIRQRVSTSMHASHALVDLVAEGYHAIAQSWRPAVTGEVQQTADVALLYERWVWVTVLRALGCTSSQMRLLLNGHGEFCSDAGVMCAYQRRLANTPNETGWSRDGRVAVPDVMLWQVKTNGTVRACIIDAKCSFDANSPDQTAQNDVTAYLRRVGVGNCDPDVAVLVHPGGGLNAWPSGLIELGTDGIHEEPIVQFVHTWIHRQIYT